VSEYFIHPTAIVEKSSKIGKGCMIWINAQIRENAVIGSNCIISKDTYIDHGVHIGDNTKIQNGVSIYNGVTIEDEVFIGPNATFTNDKIPRAFGSGWKIIPTLIKKGASIGANSTIICGVTVGEYAMIGAGSVVTRDVEPYSLVMGNPAVHVSYIDKSGNRVEGKGEINETS